MALTGQRIEVTAGDYRVDVSANGAALAGLWHRGVAVTVDQPSNQLPLKGNGQVLMPWPNRIRNGRYAFDGVEYKLSLTDPARGNASHGLVRWSRFKVTAHQADAITLACDLVPQPGYPFEIAVQVQYRLEPETGLTVKAHATNKGEKAAPFGAGFHPYFDLGTLDLDHASIEVPAKTIVRTDAQAIPTGRSSVAGTPYDLSQLRPLGTLRLDHAFTDLTGDRVTVGVGGRRVALWWDDAFSFVQVFTPAEISFGRRGIAIEPMTCAADAYNSGEGLVRLEPGASWDGTWGISVG